MAERRVKKVLVGLDGSDRAMAVVKYLSNISSLNRCEITLMTVFDEIPQAYRDLAQQQYYRSRIREVMAWDTQHKRELEKQANAARQILIHKGIPEAAVTIKFSKRERGSQGI